MIFSAVALFCLYCMYMRGGYIFFANSVVSGYELDTGHLFEKVGLLTVQSRQEEYPTGENLESPPVFMSLSNLYTDQGKYRFKVPIDSYNEVGICYGVSGDMCYSLQFYDVNEGIAPDAVMKIALTEIGGKNIVMLLPTGKSYSPGDEISHMYLSKLPDYVLHDLGYAGFEGMDVLGFAIDLRDIMVEDENTDFLMVIIFSLVFPAFLLYALACFIKPQVHPNYIQMSWQGDIAKICGEVDREIRAPDVYREKKDVYTENYVIRHSMYMTTVKPKGRQKQTAE